MAVLSTSKLIAGMKTLSEVVDQHGHTLIRANEEISDKHITLLKMWGVAEVDVKGALNELDLEYLKALYPASLIDSIVEESHRKLQFLDSESLIKSCLQKIFVENEAKRNK